MKKPTRDAFGRLSASERQRMCTRKRRYRTQGDALDAAQLLGLARQRQAYLCPLCRQWHLSSG
jgi:hypothetical protein